MLTPAQQQQKREYEIDAMMCQIKNRAKDAVMNMPEVPLAIKDISKLLDEAAGLYADWILAERRREGKEESRP